jgi:hypothetical protein
MFVVMPRPWFLTSSELLYVNLHTIQKSLRCGGLSLPACCYSEGGSHHLDLHAATVLIGLKARQTAGLARMSGAVALPRGK